MSDLDNAMQILNRSFNDPLYGSNSDVSISTFEAQAFSVFDITVLSHVAMAAKPIIGVRALIRIVLLPKCMGHLYP